MQIDKNWRHEVCGSKLGYDQNVLLDSVCIRLLTMQLHNRHPFHNTISIVHWGHDCKPEYMNGNQGIMPESHYIWVQYMPSQVYNLDNSFQWPIPSCPVQNYCGAAPNQLVHFQQHLPYGPMILTFSMQCNMSPHWQLHLEAAVDAVLTSS